MSSLFKKILQGLLTCLAVASLSACDSSSNTSPAKPGHKVEDPTVERWKKIEKLKTQLAEMEKKLNEYYECLDQNEQEDCAAIADELNSVSEALNNKDLENQKE